ncbi:MAG TPA: SRPBCC family protein [Nitrospira sp.]|nr:SRPBCC family protein [Nitrospira sp.]
MSGKTTGLSLPCGWVLTICVSYLLTGFPAVAVETTQELLDVKTDPAGGVRAIALMRFPASPAVIQAMLTDYQHWPDLFEVRMRLVDLKIHQGVATVDLRIDHALLPGERRLVTESRAVPNGGIVTDLVGGDFKRYHRVWKLSPVNGGTETIADFELVVAIDSIVPDWLVALATRRELETHFRIVKEKALARSKLEK